MVRPAMSGSSYGREPTCLKGFEHRSKLEAVRQIDTEAGVDPLDAGHVGFSDGGVRDSDENRGRRGTSRS